jgi:hypothetical protein
MVRTDADIDELWSMLANRICVGIVMLQLAHFTCIHPSLPPQQSDARAQGHTAVPTPDWEPPGVGPDGRSSCSWPAFLVMQVGGYMLLPYTTSKRDIHTILQDPTIGLPVSCDVVRRTRPSLKNVLPTSLLILQPNELNYCRGVLFSLSPWICLHVCSTTTAFHCAMCGHSWRACVTWAMTWTWVLGKWWWVMTPS